jgi:hypothetical protein
MIPGGDKVTTKEGDLSLFQEGWNPHFNCVVNLKNQLDTDYNRISKLLAI